MSGVLGPIDSKSLGPAFVTPQHAKRIGVCNQLESGKDSSNDGVCDNIKLESGSDYFFDGTEQNEITIVLHGSKGMILTAKVRTSQSLERVIDSTDWYFWQKYPVR